MIWTQARVETLRSSWAIGLSSAQIAKALGITRNAVIGKAWRLGLCDRRVMRKARKPRPEHRRVPKPRPAPAPAPCKSVSRPLFALARQSMPLGGRHRGIFVLRRADRRRAAALLRASHAGKSAALEKDIEVRIERHSPSSLSLFCADPGMYVLERILGQKQPVGAAAHRGTAVEAGIALALVDAHASLADAVAQAHRTYDTLTALSGDPRREDQRKLIEGMVGIGLAELRPYGEPGVLQGFVEWKPAELTYPIVGYYDFFWERHGILVDLKTTERLHSQIQVPHARQVALYTAAISDNIDGRITYVTPKKCATYKLENAREHRNALLQIALRCEAFLALSDDPLFYTTIIAPDFSSFYWSNPAARQAGFEVFGF